MYIYRVRGIYSSIFNRKWNFFFHFKKSMYIFLTSNFIRMYISFLTVEKNFQAGNSYPSIGFRTCDMRSRIYWSNIVAQDTSHIAKWHQPESNSKSSRCWWKSLKVKFPAVSKSPLISAFAFHFPQDSEDVPALLFAKSENAWGKLYRIFIRRIQILYPL